VFESLYKAWHGVGCQIHRQARHGAAHSLATSLEAAEFIPRLATANAQLIFRTNRHFTNHSTQTRTQTEAAIAYRKWTSPNAHVPPPVSFFEATPPGAAPGPPVKTGPRVRVASGGVKKALRQQATWDLGCGTN